jgi:hypothetical protein
MCLFRHFSRATVDMVSHMGEQSEVEKDRRKIQALLVTRNQQIRDLELKVQTMAAKDKAHVLETTRFVRPFSCQTIQGA